MTATLPILDAATQAHLLVGVTTALVGDAERFNLAPIGINVDANWGHTSAHLQFPNGHTASVDTLARAYGLPSADPDTGLYLRKGPVVIDGVHGHVTVYCARPTPAGGALVPVAPGGALPVASERADTPRALT